MQQLLKALKNVLADFKTVRQKFNDCFVASDLVDSYLNDFKELRDKNRIKNINEKNIDYWGKKSWDDFKSFVDKTIREKSTTETKKLKKMKGAELIAENDGWYVYHITTYEACKIYGSGTRWCITESSGNQWRRYSEKKNIYFILAKSINLRNKDTIWYKIAVLVDMDGDMGFWDSTDNFYSSLPPELKTPKVNFEKFNLNKY